ncbi:TPA: type II toxin-antitoxin system VapC family toxin [Candidatus Woesearchaeota archaeon]|nr:type II toxin-antitoxin system VapC family toxin [Candidatus Woesearchaeota archaeon]HIH47675.1 type II toxin-antitoxin system VapC family toxin [Candidatus Woesearchaeota archaeon]
MSEKFYIDTSIWIDLYEDRKGYHQEPLGDFALRLFSMIKTKEHKLIITDILINELEGYYSQEEINGMMKPFEAIIKKVISTTEQRQKARQIAQRRNLPPGDVLHAILAHDHQLILVTRDNDFRKLTDICEHFKPEDLI